MGTAAFDGVFEAVVVIFFWEKNEKSLFIFSSSMMQPIIIRKAPKTSEKESISPSNTSYTERCIT